LRAQRERRELVATRISKRIAAACEESDYVRQFRELAGVHERGPARAAPKDRRSERAIAMRIDRRVGGRQPSVVPVAEHPSRVERIGQRACEAGLGAGVVLIDEDHPNSAGLQPHVVELLIRQEGARMTGHALATPDEELRATLFR